MHEDYPDERAATGSLPTRLTDNNVQGITSSRPLANEIWENYDYLCRVKSARDDFIRSKGITDVAEIDKIGKEFSSYLTQSKNFYKYAESSDYRSAALLYYYSFLNLVKAILIVHKPELSGKKFMHGLQRKVKEGSLDKMSIGLSPSRNKKDINTFDELYKFINKNDFPAKENVTLLDLFSYSTDIAFEYEAVAGKPNNVSYVKYVIAIDSNSKKSWNKLAVNHWQKHSSNINTFKQFETEFTKVKVSPLYRQTQFELKGMNYGITFFESQTQYDFIGSDGINWLSCRMHLNNLLNGLYQTSVYDIDEHSFEMLSPINDKTEVRLNELTSTYMAMYYLSEIVRYKPQLFDEEMDPSTKDGWLLKAFIEQAPVTFIYRSLSLLKSVDVIISRRF